MAKDILTIHSSILRQAAAVVLIATMAAGCGGGQPHAEEAHVSDGASDPAETETYTVTGRIMSVTPDRDFVMVRHDAIEGFMDAMTMPFALGDTSLVTGISAGDSIAFVLEVSRGEAEITSLEKR